MNMMTNWFKTFLSVMFLVTIWCTPSFARQLGDVAGEGGPADGQVDNIDALFAAQVVEDTQTPTPTQGIDGDVSPFFTDPSNVPLEDINGCRLSDPDGDLACHQQDHHWA